MLPRRWVALRVGCLGLLLLHCACTTGSDEVSRDNGGGSDGDPSSPGDATTTGGSGDATTIGGSGGSPLPTGEGALPLPAIDNDAPTDGATITYLNIGGPGWYPSRRDPSSGMCDAVNSGSCCMTQHNYTSSELAPWDEDLIMQLRGPMLVERYAVYQPETSGDWRRTAVWDKSEAVAPSGLVFGADGVAGAGFDGAVGSTCVIDVMADTTVPCGAGSVPYCEGEDKHDGFRGSKLFVVLAKTPHMGSPEAEAISHCAGADDNWYDAPWIGLTHGELVRSGKFGSCHCYAKNPDEWWEGDGCGQFNVFEVINDNNDYTNLSVFSTNIFGPEYIGGGPCAGCSFASLPDSAELVSKANNTAASTGETTEPGRAPGYAIRRPSNGYRYFVVLLDAPARTIQTGIIHPDNVPASVGALLPGLPESVAPLAISSLRDLRLPE